MWAVGENCVAAIKFEISGFYSSGARFCTPFFAQVGLRPPQIFSGWRAFQNQHFFCHFLVYSYYVSSLNDTNY